MYLDDIYWFVKKGKGNGDSITTIRIYSQDIGNLFGIKNYAMLKMKNGKRQITEGIAPNTCLEKI